MNKEQQEQLRREDGIIEIPLPNTPEVKELLKSLGNPGICLYTVESNYENAVAALDARGEFDDRSRTRKYLFKDFPYARTIDRDDFTGKAFEEDDMIVALWSVDKRLQKKEV